MAQEPQPLAEGFLLPGYRIDGLLGQGRFGFSYLATDLDLGVKVAIQEYLPHEIAFRSADGSVGPNASRHRERYQRGLACFLKDASALAGLRHPAIVRVLRFFEAQRTAYLVLEHEKGVPLKQWWPQHRGGGEAALVALLRPLCDALAVVHAAGLLHRDLRPETIHVRPDGAPVLRDFGSASLALAVALDSAAVSSPGYAAPELRREGAEGPRTDLYALAATLYWCVSGHRPPDAERRAADPRARVRAVEAGRGRFGSAFLQTVDRALALEPARRPHDVLEFRRELLADHPAPSGADAGALQVHDTVIAGAEADPPAAPVHRRAGWAPAAWPLQAKALLLVLAAALLPLALAAAWQAHGAAAALQAAHAQRLQAQAQGAAWRVGQWLAAQREQARALASDQDVVLYLARPDETARLLLGDALARLLAAHPAWASVALVGRDGRVLLASDPALEGRDLGAAPPLQSPLQSALQSALGGRAQLSGGAGPVWAEPVAGDDGRVLGALAIGLRPDVPAELLAPWRTEAGLRPWLVDADGVLLEAPQPAWRGRSLQPPAPARADARGGRDTIAGIDLPALAAALAGARAPGHVTFGLPGDGAQLAGYAPVPGQPWVVAVSESRAGLDAAQAALWRPLAWGLPLAAAVFGLLAWRFGRGLARPLRQLTGAAGALTAGDLHNATVPVQRRDELGQLARAFNVMVDVVRQRERERERDRGG